MALNPDDLERYGRQILFKPLGRKGQERLAAIHALVAGVGGLGSPLAMYLTVAGVGEITLADFDTVTLSNLNRQLLHGDGDMGRRKVLSAKAKLTGLNPTIKVHAIPEKITPKTCESLLDSVDIVVDCLDNMASRYTLNRACVRWKIPLVHGGVYGLMGQLTTIIPGRTPCLECIFPRKKTTPGPIPVFGATAGFIASLQALEAIKLITGIGKNLAGRLLYFNAEVMECVVSDFKKNPNCPVCRDTKAS